MSIAALQQPQLVPPPQPTAEPTFLRQNWKKLLACDSRDEMRFVRVTQGVANITNGQVLIRYPLLNVPDGFYVLDERNLLVETRASSPRWMAYPDTETCRPPFDHMIPSMPLPHAVVLEMVNFFEFCAKQAAAHTGYYSNKPAVILNRTGFYLSSDPNLCYRIDLSNLPTGNDIVLSSTSLKFALVEMLRYTETFISREANLNEEKCPIVFGRDWGHCALVLPNVEVTGRSNYVRYH